MNTPPSFPPPFVIERIRSLGYGSGPWQREQLIQLWDAPMADKFIAEARLAGWLVSPFRGTYFVPTAQDLMVVGWLPEAAKQEFLISRSLAGRGIRYWCLSAWTRKQGLELGGPVFVSDLANLQPASEGPAQPNDRRELRAQVLARANKFSSVPFVDALVFVPAMPPPSGRPQAQVVTMPESAESASRRQNQQMWAEAIMGIIGLITWAATKRPPDFGDFQNIMEGAEMARAIPYSLGRDIDDPNWIVALLASLGTPRSEEFLRQAFKQKKMGIQGDAVQKWAGLIGPPQPNDRWQDVLREGPFPFLLVPPILWNTMGADQASRRYRMLQRLDSG